MGIEKGQKSAEKPKKARIIRILKKKEPLLVENTKQALLLKGNHTSQVINDVLVDLNMLLKPQCKKLSRKNDILPFEDANSLEFLCQKNDCSLFAVGTHSKKRPNNLILGRCYDGHILDMVEFGLENVQFITDFAGYKKSVGSKPIMLFQGDQWDSDTTYGKLQNLFIDVFRGAKVDKVALKGLDHVLAFTVVDGVIHLRTYVVSFKKSGSKTPNVELKPMGPFMDLTLRRFQFASDDLWKTACKQPKQVKPPKVKNISRTELGQKVGRIHVGRQDLDNMGGKFMRVLRKRKTTKSSDQNNESSVDNSGRSKRSKYDAER